AQSVCSDDGAQLAVTLPVERTIDGKYRLDHLIGRGGMGAVYRGTDVRLGREVAIKVLTGALFGDQAALRRFEREAQASARLSHVNIVTVFDYGSLGTDGAYLVMEYVKGKTLRHELRRDTSLAPERIAFIIDGVCDAVAEAHKAGVIHRDLKPENILLTDSEDPRHQLVKVLDFGIAKVLTEGNSSGAISSITVPGSIMGTFGYMSPEQLEGRPVDVRTDVFALGVIVIEALTGSRPFSGSTIPALAASMAADGVEINLVAPEMSETIDVLRRSVSHDPDRRHGTVDEFRDAIMKALRLAEGGAKPVAGPGEEPDAPTVFVPSSPAGATELRSSERPAEDDFPVTEVIGSGPEPAAPAAPAVQGQTDTGNEPEAQ
ncbi:MAG: serine/threonine-protein kinase, partial [Blastocatellia bacterium]